MESANIFVPIAMFGCIVVFLALFALLPPRRALLISFLGSWLFLPIASYEIIGLPDYSKLFATCFGILLAVFFFDFRRLLTIRPKWIDIPMIIWCIVPFGASITNFGMNFEGLYDGFSESLAQVFLWGVPYFLGRIYFTNWKELRELTFGIMLSGVIYTPFLLFEMRMTPQLHRIFYGYHQHLFLQTERFGFSRPMVFMHHGLMTAFWMMAVALVAIWMWRSGTFTHFHIGSRRFSAGWVVFYLISVSMMMVSVNAWVFLLLGTVALFASESLNTRFIVVVLMCVVPVYAFLQGSSLWPTDMSVDFITGILGEERAQSLEFRYFNEEYLTEKAREQPIFGWAGWDRQHVDLGWGQRTVADSMWVTFFGKFGTVGLTSLILSILLPAILVFYRYPPNIWARPQLAPAVVLSVILVLYMIDGLLNNMINPLYMLAAGGLQGAYANLPATSKAPEPIKSTGPVPAQAAAD